MGWREGESRNTPSSPSKSISGVLLTYISGYIRLGIGETGKNTRCGAAGLELGHRSGKERSKGERQSGVWSASLR